MTQYILMMGMFGCTKINSTDKDNLVHLLGETGIPGGVHPEDFENHSYIEFLDIIGNEFIQFGPQVGSYLLDWKQDWSFSLLINNVGDLDASAHSFMGFKNGSNIIGFNIREDQFDIYYWDDVHGMMNFPLDEDLGLLKSNDRITISYRVVNDSGTMTVWRNDQMTSKGFGMLGSGENLGSLTFAEDINDDYTQPFSGGVDSLISLPAALGADNVAELLNTEDYRELEWLEAAGASWWPMGEDQFPNVLDWIQDDNALLKGGVSTQFVAYD